MTDKEKQSCGQLYNPTAGDICTMRKRGTDLARQFNSCEDPDEQKKILQTLTWHLRRLPLVYIYG